MTHFVDPVLANRQAAVACMTGRTMGRLSGPDGEEVPAQVEAADSPQWNLAAGRHIIATKVGLFYDCGCRTGEHGPELCTRLRPTGWMPCQGNREDKVADTELRPPGALPRSRAGCGGMIEPKAADHIGPNDPAHDRVNEVIGDLLNGRIVPPARQALRRVLDHADKLPVGRDAADAGLDRAISRRIG